MLTKFSKQHWGVLILKAGRENTAIALLFRWGTGANLEEVKAADQR